MVRALLREGDGLPAGRPWLGTIVKRVQMALAHAGHPLKADGQFGSGTEKVVRAFQKAKGLAQTGFVDRPTWEALAPDLAALFGAGEAHTRELLANFDGDPDWVHQQEGHRGSPYWAQGESGVTLDPGVDLGYADPALIEKLYGPLLNPAQLAAVRKALGVKGGAAQAALGSIAALKTIRITTEQAEAIMPYAARPYWDAISKRFPPLRTAGTPPSVQTVFLSLAYNRGAGNKDLAPLAAPLGSGGWSAVADAIGSMQQDHKLEGIRLRRRREADLIRSELEYLKG